MIEQKVSLKNFTNYKIGGPASYFFVPKNTDELKTGLEEWRNIQADKKTFILGGGTNVLADDSGFDGLIIHPDIDFLELAGDFKLKVGAGTTMQKVNEFCFANGLSGLEWSGGLPGTAGGAVFGNAGAFGGEIKDNVFEVESFSLEELSTKKRESKDCAFDYRTSVFKSELLGKEVIISVTFQMKPGEKHAIEKAVQEKINYRKERQPLELPSAGSTFKNVPLETLSETLKEKFKDKIKNDPFPIIPAAVFLSDAGVKGLTIGNAQVSTKHPNFIVNIGNATSKDVQDLIAKVIGIIKDKYDIVLETEVIILK